MPMNRQQLPAMAVPDMPARPGEIRAPERPQQHEARNEREARL